MEHDLQKRFARCEEYRKVKRNQLKQYVPKKGAPRQEVGLCMSKHNGQAKRKTKQMPRTKPISRSRHAYLRRLAVYQKNYLHRMGLVK